MTDGAMTSSTETATAQQAGSPGKPPTREQCVRELLLSVQGAINTMLAVTPSGGSGTVPKQVAHNFAGRYESAVKEVADLLVAHIEDAGHGRPIGIEIEPQHLAPKSTRVSVCKWQPGGDKETKH